VLALHEAGHLASAVWLRIPFTHGEIVAEIDGANGTGRAGVAPLREVLDDLSLEEMLAQLTMLGPGSVVAGEP
jgi:hypothetical protein